MAYVGEVKLTSLGGEGTVKGEESRVAAGRAMQAAFSPEPSGPRLRKTWLDIVRYFTNEKQLCCN